MKKNLLNITLCALISATLGSTVYSKAFSECTRPVFEKYVSSSKTEVKQDMAGAGPDLNLKDIEQTKTSSELNVPGPGMRDSSFPLNMPVDKPLFRGNEVEEDLKVHHGEKILNLTNHPEEKKLHKDRLEKILPLVSKSPEERENSFVAIAGYPSEDDSPEFPVGTASTRKEELLRLRALTFKINGRPDMPFFPVFSGKFENSVHRKKKEINKNPFEEVHKTDRQRLFSVRPSLPVTSRPDRPSAGTGQQIPGTGPGTSMPYIPRLP